MEVFRRNQITIYGLIKVCSEFYKRTKQPKLSLNICVCACIRACLYICACHRAPSFGSKYGRSGHRAPFFGSKYGHSGALSFSPKCGHSVIINMVTFLAHYLVIFRHSSDSTHISEGRRWTLLYTAKQLAGYVSASTVGKGQLVTFLVHICLLKVWDCSPLHYLLLDLYSQVT